MNTPKTASSPLAVYQSPHWNDFPQVDLYMDQVILLLRQWLEPLYFDSKKPCITPSMINNYVKNSIVKPPLKKRYKPYHLAYLYVVMVLKQCFSLQEISVLIGIYSTFDSEQIASHFNTFSSTFESMLHEIMKTGQISYAPHKNPGWEQLLMINCIRAVCCRLYGAVIIEEYQNQKAEQKAK